MLNFTYNQFIDEVLTYLDGKGLIDKWANEGINWFSLGDYEITKVHIRNNVGYITIKSVTILLVKGTSKKLVYIPVEEEVKVVQAEDGSLSNVVGRLNSELIEELNKKEVENSDVGGIYFKQTLDNRDYKELIKEMKSPKLYKTMDTKVIKDFQKELISLKGEELVKCLKRQERFEEYLKLTGDHSKIKTLKVYDNGVKIYVSTNGRADFEVLYSGQKLIASYWDNSLDKRFSEIVADFNKQSLIEADAKVRMHQKVHNTFEYLNIIPVLNLRKKPTIKDYEEL